MKYTIRVCDEKQGKTSDDRIVCETVHAKSPEEAVRRVLEKVNQFPGELFYADEVGHTPGPWVYDHSPKPMHNRIVIGQAFRDSEGGGDIAEIVAVRLPESFCVEGEFDRAYADARLIAAAPEMLAALSEAEGWLTENHVAHTEDCERWENGEAAIPCLLCRIREIIAKAKGQQHD